LNAEIIVNGTIKWNDSIRECYLRVIDSFELRLSYSCDLFLVITLIMWTDWRKLRMLIFM